MPVGQQHAAVQVVQVRRDLHRIQRGPGRCENFRDQRLRFENQVGCRILPSTALQVLRLPMQFPELLHRLCVGGLFGRIGPGWFNLDPAIGRTNRTVRL